MVKANRVDKWIKIHKLLLAGIVSQLVAFGTVDSKFVGSNPI